MSLRILTLVHNHKSTSYGGSEHAAFALDQAYQRNEAWILTPNPAITKPKSTRCTDCERQPSHHNVLHKWEQRNQQLYPP